MDDLTWLAPLGVALALLVFGERFLGWYRDRRRLR
jgi:hypothetical protein